jgi:hypothetical protein
MKNCKQFRSWIWLAGYDELPAEQRKLLEEHLKTCSECQLDVEEAMSAKKLMDQKIQFAPTEFQLESSRAELHQRLLLLTQARYHKDWKAKLWQIVSLDFTPALRFATAVALLVIGLFAGKMIFTAEKRGLELSQQQLSEALTSNVSNIESIEYNPATRQVSIKMNTLNDVTIQGDVEKPEIQQLLAQSLVGEERPDMKLKTVRALGNTRTLDVKTLSSLSELIDKEENAGIRLKAVRLLTSIPITSAVKDILTQVLVRVLLNDSNSAIRIEAFKGLSKIGNGSATPVIFNAARNDSSEYIRTKAKQMLERTENPNFRQ